MPAIEPIAKGSNKTSATSVQSVRPKVRDALDPVTHPACLRLNVRPFVRANNRRNFAGELTKAGQTGQKGFNG